MSTISTIDYKELLIDINKDLIIFSEQNIKNEEIMKIIFDIMFLYEANKNIDKEEDSFYALLATISEVARQRDIYIGAADYKNIKERLRDYIDFRLGYKKEYKRINKIEKEIRKYIGDFMDGNNGFVGFGFCLLVNDCSEGEQIIPTTLLYKYLARVFMVRNK